MNKLVRTIRSTTRQLAILTSVTGLTFAGDIKWAEAAEAGAGVTGEMPGELHVIMLFLLTLGVLAATLCRPQQRALVRGRPEIKRARR